MQWEQQKGEGVNWTFGNDVGLLLRRIRKDYPQQQSPDDGDNGSSYVLRDLSNKVRFNARADGRTVPSAIEFVFSRAAVKRLAST